MNETVKKILTAVAKLALGVAIIYVILNKLVDKNPAEQLGIALENWPWLLAGVSIFGICMLVVTYRWYLLLHAQGIPMPMRRVLSVCFIGHFFNSFLIGATGGDLIKAVYTARESGEKKTEGVATVFIDRIVGLVGVVFLAAIMTVIYADFYRLLVDQYPKQTYPLLVFLAAITAATIGLFVVAFSQNIFERWPLFRWALKRFPKVGTILKRVYDSFYLYREKRGVLAATLLLSFANHLLLIAMAWTFSKALQVSLTISNHTAVVPLANMAGSVPLTPGGLGTRDAAYLALYTPYGPEAKDAAVIMSLMVYCSMLVWSLVGGIFYFFYKSGHGTVSQEELDELNAEG